MIELSEYIKALSGAFGIWDDSFSMDLSRLLVSNKWFGAVPLEKDGRFFLSDDNVSSISVPVEEFCARYGDDYEKKTDGLGRLLNEAFPNAASMLLRFSSEKGLAKGDTYVLQDFLMYHLAGELPSSMDREVEDIVGEAFEHLPKGYADLLADFLNWLKLHTKTMYKNVFFMQSYSEDDQTTNAYAPEIYEKILFRLYNADYIEENDMYAQAAKSKNYADTWLFLAIHFLCALRNTDLMQLPHPQLLSSPEDVLKMAEEGTLPDHVALRAVESIDWYLKYLLVRPSKTTKYRAEKPGSKGKRPASSSLSVRSSSGIASIKLHIPVSVEVHLGTLFAVAEAHFRLSGADPEKPLIRVISSYEQITSYMGDEIGELFLEANFHTRSMNKSYMQMIYLLTDDILGINDEFNVKGYMLAALARSHKGSYGEFARTTSVYLKDAKMNGYTPEFVARELFERGVLSSIPTMLLKMVTNGEYDKLSVTNQTRLLKELDMSPRDVDHVVGIMQANMKRSVAVVQDIYKGFSKEQILTALHRIGNGNAVSKSDCYLCVVTAFGLPCPFPPDGEHPDGKKCPGCRYEISTKTTMGLMAREYVRLKDSFDNSKIKAERDRSRAIAQKVVIPAISEMLSVMEETYGREAVESLEKVISEVSHEG